MKHRLLTTLTAALLALSAWAYDAKIDGIYYNFIGSTAIVTLGDSKYQGDIIIPATVTYDGTTYSVTSIDSSVFAGCTGLTSITIPSSVTSIGSSAFNGCTGLTNITIPSSVTEIGSRAFVDCTGLTSIKVEAGNTKYDSRDNCNAIIKTASNTLVVGCKATTIPSSVTSIGSYAFYGCTSLTSINIPNSVTSIGNYAFSGCSGLTSITIPSSVTSIGNYAFSGCTGLTSITIPSSVTSIGSYAFYGCSGLTSITIPSSVTSIGIYAFSGCTGLTSITIPSSVKSIDRFAFSYCSGLTSVSIPPSVTSIGDYAFARCSGLTSITIPSSVTSIGEGAFIGCSGLTNINIPPSVTSIGSFAFDGCTSLTSVTINSNNVLKSGKLENRFGKQVSTYILGDHVTSIGSYAFYGCTGLTSISIPESVTSIGYEAFRGCTGLTSITIPSSVTSIGSYAFYGCTGLTSISIPESVTSIGSYAFSYCKGLTSITIPSSVTSIGDYAFLGCTGLTCIDIPDAVTTIGVQAFSFCTSLTSVTIGNSVTTIENWAFNDCTALKYITALRTDPAAYNCSTSAFNDYSPTLHVPTGCKEAYASTRPWSSFASIVDDIDNSSDDAVVLTADGEEVWTDGVLRFSVSSEENGEAVVSGVKDKDNLGAVTIPEKVKIADKVYSVTGIGEKAFYGCYGLTSITIPNSVTSIGFGAFEYCTGLTSITIPNSVITIGSWAFSGCTGLTSITIPSSVTSIGSAAFNNCTGLTSIKVEAGNTKYDSRDNCNAIIETASNILVAGCKATTIPSSVTSIGSWAFSGCTGLTSIDIPNSVTSIDSYAFIGCTGLTSITIPSSVTSIGSGAFSGCTGLTSITIPNSVTSIGELAFSDCTGLTSIEVETGNTKYDSRDNCNAIIETASNTLVAGCKATSIPSSVTSIGGSAFEGCTGLTSITIPSSVTSIGRWAFANCSGLTSIDIPNSVTTIGNRAFYICTNLTDVYIGNSVTSIGEDAFADCTGLTSISIPESVTGIGATAFKGCEGLKYINAFRTDPEAYNCATDAFRDVPTSTCTLYVLSGSKDAYKAIEPWSNFANIEEEPIQVGGLLYTIQGNEATCVGPGSVEGWFNNPVENIPERITFDGKEYIVTAVEGVSYDGSIIVLPKTLKRIGSLSAQNNVIICLSPTPPEIESTSVSRCALYVPDEYLEEHRKGWVNDGKLFGNRYNSSLDVEAYPNLISYYIRPMSHLLNYVYDDETMTATINGFRLWNSTVISDALGCTSSRMSSNYRERIWAEHNDINLDWVVPATITKFQYIYAGTQTRVKTGETYAVKKVAKLLGARSVTLSEGIEEVGQSAFSLDLWPVVTDAEGNAQYYNDPLESVSLPSTLKLLDRSAFTGCTSLKHVEMKEGLDSIGMSAFTYCLSLEDCHLPASLRAMGIGHGNLYSLQAFSTAQGSENIVAKDGVLFSDGGKTLLQYPAGKPDTTYEVPEGTVKLSEWSFEAVQELESIILPASVEEIGTWIFANTHCLKHIYCKSQTPPDKIGGWWLKASAPIRPDDAVLSSYDIYNEVTVHVPTGCKEIYANTIGWKGFNIVEEEDLTGIASLTLSPSEAGESYYNLQGQRIAEPQRGQLVIVRRADGSSRKMYVR